MNNTARMALTALAWLLLAWAPTQAAVIAVAASPPAANVPVGQSGSVQLRWMVTATLGVGAPRVSSNQGIFRANGPGGPVLGRNNLTIASMAQPTGQQMAITSIPESLLIPARVVLRAQVLGARRIVYQRTFSDGGAGAVGTLTLNLAGGLGSGFAITRVALRFADGSQEKIVAPAATTFVFADITHTGSGRLMARWEVAEPVTTRGQPIFRTVAVVNRQLIGSGARTTLRSPNLPTRGDGAYLVRLTITRPATGFAAPVLRYFVNPALTPLPEPVTITLRGPADGADYTTGLDFVWQPLTGVATYQLEFHDLPPMLPDPDPVGDPAIPRVTADHRDLRPIGKPRGKPISGIVVPAAINAVALSPLALTHLAPDHGYWWRVVAFDAAGHLIGRSPLRLLRVPADAP